MTGGSGAVVLAADLLVAQNIAFYLIAAAMVFAAIRVVTCQNMVHAALWLVIVLGGAAAQFILLAAEFVAITQVLVYIGAIVVLLLFGVMLTRAQTGPADLDNSTEAKLVAGVVGVVLLGVIGFTMIDTFGTDHVGNLLVQRTEQVADSLFANYILPFEIVGVLLTAALLGAIVLARRD